MATKLPPSTTATSTLTPDKIFGTPTGSATPPHTLDILQGLSFKYHINEPSMDQLLIVKLKGGDFVTVPYTFHMNDIVAFPFVDWNPAAYEQPLKDEFDQLYEEGARKRQMMVVSLHDRISGRADRVRALNRFLAYAKSKPGVWFAREDEIANALRASILARLDRLPEASV